MTLIIVLAVLALLILWVISLYNNFVKLRNRTHEAWSDIDVQLKRRHDLIPNLISSVKGYMTHEKEILEKVTALRSQAMDQQKAGNTAALGQTEGMLGSMLGKLQVAVEAYPDLKANQNVSQLMSELSDTENKIQASRRFYNGMVRDFNIALETFPNNLLASLLNSKKFEFFETADAERENVKVEL